MGSISMVDCRNTYTFAQDWNLVKPKCQNAFYSSYRWKLGVWIFKSVCIYVFIYKYCEELCKWINSHSRVYILCFSLSISTAWIILRREGERRISLWKRQCSDLLEWLIYINGDVEKGARIWFLFPLLFCCDCVQYWTCEL